MKKGDSVTVKDIIHSICNEQGISLSQAAENIGMTRGALWSILGKNEGMNIKIGTLVRYIEELGCQLVVVSGETEEEYLLDGMSDDVVLDTSRRKEEW